MNVIYDNQERECIAQARESFSGRLMAGNQFKEAIAITGIMEREIHKSGAFKQKLGDYAHAFARTEKIDAMRAEQIIRDLFKARTGQTMNQMREALMERETKLFGREEKQLSDGSTQEAIKAQLSDAGKERAHNSAKDVGHMIKDGNKISFHRAYAHQATELAQDFGITESGAKTLMKEQLQENQNLDLYDWGKELEEKYYKPQIKAEKEAREEARSKTEDREQKHAYQRSR